MQWTAPALSIGWLVALITLIVTLILFVMGAVSKEAAMVVVAICAVRL